MNKKTIIQIAAIIVLFGASGAVLYNGLYGSKTASLPGIDLTGPQGTENLSVEKILPNGDTFELEAVLKKQGLQFGSVQFPKLDPSSEVGISEKALINPLPTRARE